MKPSKRVIASAFALCLAIGANAQWTVVSLHPAGSRESWAYSVEGGTQYGVAWFPQGPRASAWTGSSASWQSLHPAGRSYSWINASRNGVQVGKVDGGAAMWTGSPESYVDLHPPGAISSEALGTNGTQQAGWAKYDNVNTHAALWNGTRASYVDLHPFGATNSIATGVSNGLQVGTSDNHAYAWRGSSASARDIHPPSLLYSGARGFNDGLIFGSGNSNSPFGIWGIAWGAPDAGAWLTIHTGWYVNFYDCNGGQFVGDSVVYNHDWHASLWRSAAAGGGWVDLHQFLPAGYRQSAAYGIDFDANATYIVGIGQTDTNPAEVHAFLWIGPPPPSDDFTFSINRSSVAGQNSVLGTIQLGAALSTNSLFMVYPNTDLVDTPPYVVLKAGIVAEPFQITVRPVASSTVTVVFVRRGTVTRSQDLILNPIVPTAMLFTPNAVTGGAPTLARVVLNGVAPPGGEVLTIADNSSYAAPPSSIVIPAGASSASFMIPTLVVPSSQTVRLTLTCAGGTKTSYFRIIP